MAQLGESFDYTQVEPRDSLEPVPPGVYVAEVVESDVVQTKNGAGQRVTLTMRITEGPCEGRQIWDGINFQHASDVAQRIGQQQLAELCAAVGLRGPLEDTTDLHGIPIKIKVKMSKPQEGYDQRNEVSRYMPIDGAAPATQPARSPAPAAQRQAAPPQKAASSGGARPWQR